MDVSPKQLVSVAAGLDSVSGTRRRKPRADGFEHATSGRAAARHRGAARGTGLEERVARDSRAVLVAEEAGKVASVTGRPDHHHRKTANCRKARRRLRHDPATGIYVYPIAQVHAVECGHLHQPEDPGGRRAST